jgi:hypothetical protein
MRRVIFLAAAATLLAGCAGTADPSGTWTPRWGEGLWLFVPTKVGTYKRRSSAGLSDPLKVDADRWSAQCRSTGV